MRCRFSEYSAAIWWTAGDRLKLFSIIKTALSVRNLHPSQDKSYKFLKGLVSEGANFFVFFMISKSAMILWRGTVYSIHVVFSGCVNWISKEIHFIPKEQKPKLMDLTTQHSCANRYLNTKRCQRLFLLYFSCICTSIFCYILI